MQESEFYIGINKDPISFSQAIKSIESEKWNNATNEELKSMKYNKIWGLVQLQESYKLIGCRWVVKIKHDSNSTLERYKARPFSKRHTQNKGIDYKETFSAFLKKDSLRISLALAAHYYLELHPMDVKIVFFNGDLEENIYLD